MIRAMRSQAKWIMLILVLAFVGWMVFEVGMDIGGQNAGVSVTDAAARVNGVEIDLQTYYAALRQAQEEQRQRLGSAPTTLEEERALEDAVLENLIQEILLRQEYARRGITVTDTEIREMAQTSPPPELLQVETFHTEGQFDLAKYQRYLASNPDPTFLRALEDRYRAEIPRIKLYQQLVADLYLPDARLWQMYRDQNDSVTVRLLEIRPDVAVADSEVTVTDADIRAHYDANRSEFERPATAYLSYVSEPRFANALDSAAALQRARDLIAEVQGGTDFADVARRESTDSVSAREGGDLGIAPNENWVPEFTAAARALRPGQVSEPVLSSFGYHIIKLERLTPDSLHASHILIPVELAGDHLEYVESRADTLDLYAAEQSDPTALDDVADMLGTNIKQAAPVTEGNRVFAERGPVPDGAVWAFGAVPGETSTVVETADAFYVFRLDSLHEQGVPDFAEIEPLVRQAAIRAAKWERARELAGTLDADLKNGQAIMDAALNNMLNANTVGPMTRINPAPPFRQFPTLLGAAFGLGVGEASGPIETETSIVFVEPAAKHVADSSAFEDEKDGLRSQLTQALQQERIRLFLLSLRDGADVDDRRRAIDRAQRELEELGDQRGPFNPLGF